jgi:hypothetical protein
MSGSVKPPYVRQIGKRGDLKVWVVDGIYIRGHMDEEFTNFGQHYRYCYIPKDELWIDQATKQDETHFFVDHLLVEHRLMAKGMSYEEALVKADQAERRERRFAGDLRLVRRRGEELPKGVRVHERLWKRLENGLTVWIVDGRLVRSVFDVDFTAGGHDHVYEFVPHNEVWIDDDLEEEERPYVLLHELHERSRMANGWPYSKAHAESSELEYRCRHHPDELHEALTAEGWA